jgi:HK97 family phage major capsid protein
MNKRDINDRLNVINTRLNEMVTLCESESRRLTEAEEQEKSALIEERSNLNQQLNEINQQSNFKTMEENKKPNFSLLQTVRSIVNGGRFEGEYADEVRAMAEKSGLGYGGQIQMKASMSPEMRALNGILTAGDNFTSNSKNGGLEMVRTDVLPIIEALYNFTVLERSGANFYNGLIGNAKIPVMSNINFGFKAENAEADKVTPTMAKVDLTPQRLTGVIWMSKQLLNQTSEDLEARLRLSIVKAIAQAFEKAVLGYGTSPHNGIMYNATTVAKASLTYDTILAMAEDLYGSNYMPTFVLDPKGARFLKQIAKLSGGSEAIMFGGRVDDEQTYITNSIDVATATSAAITCADFSRLHVGTWGDLLDITVDNVTKATFGEVGLVLNYYCDWGWDAANGTAFSSREITNA